MKFEIETKIKNEQKKIRTTQTKPYHPYKYKNRLCSTPNLNNLKIVEKRSGRLSLIPISIKNNLFKKTKSFDLDEENNKKLRKRIRTQIYDKIQRDEILKRIDEVVESDDSEDENLKNKKQKNISFSPNSNFIFVFDLFLIMANLYFFIFIPLRIAKNENIFAKEQTFKEIIKYLNDLIYLFDFLISLVRGYYNYEMEMIRSNRKILIHYLKQDFFLDLIQGIPVYCLSRIIYKKNEYFYFWTTDFKMFFIKILYFIKSFKIFKVMGKKKNKALEEFYRFLSIYYYIEKIVIFMISFLIFLLFIHLFICLHIFFALQSYPNWSHIHIMKIKNL